MFRAYFDPPKITQHTLVTSTVHTVTFRSGLREVTECKWTGDYKWCETVDEAREALVNYWQKVVAQSIKTTEYWQECLKEAETSVCLGEGVDTP